MFVGGARVAAVLIAAALPVVRPWLAALPSLRGNGVVAGRTATPSQADPFAGTAAAGYPRGSAGIVLPKAKAVDGFTQGEVDQALRKVRDGLIAGRLDERMLVRHDPEPFLALLTSQVRGDTRAWFPAREFTSVATWIDPAVKLNAKHGIRVSGRIAYASVMSNGVRQLQITTNFVWVYSFDTGDPPLAAVHDTVRWDFYKAPGIERGMTIGELGSYLYWMDCAAGDRALLRPAVRHRQTVPDPRNTETADDYLQVGHGLDVGNGCR